MYKHPTMYISAIKGTNAVHTRAILLMPPINTNAVSIVNTTAI